MLEALRLGDWSVLDIRALGQPLTDQPIYAALLVPVVLALLSRSLPALAGAIGMTALALASALTSPSDSHRLVLPSILGFAAALFAVSGFGQRRIAKRTRETELKLIEAERRLTELHERELLKAVRRRTPELSEAAAGGPDNPASKPGDGLELRPYPSRTR